MKVEKIQVYNQKLLDNRTRKNGGVFISTENTVAL